MDKEETKKLMQDSLAYERAYSSISRILDDVLERKNDDKEMSKETGEPVDPAYGILAADLDGLKRAYRTKSDELWLQWEKSADHYDEGYDRLFMAIMERAVLDYEAALCGHGSEEEKRMIEKLGMKSILGRVRKAHPEFVKVCHEKGKQIWDETQEARRKRKDIDEWNTVTCPLCGHPLYAFGKLIGGSATIKCTGCAFSEVVCIADEK